jgi:hypothetical protein
MRRDIDNCEAWANFETWTVRKWMLDEPEVAESWNEVIDRLLECADLSKDRGKLSKALAEELLREAETFCCSFAGGLGSELIEAAFARVNWLELADESLLDFAK